MKTRYIKTKIQIVQGTWSGINSLTRFSGGDPEVLRKYSKIQIHRNEYFVTGYTVGGSFSKSEINELNIIPFHRFVLPDAFTNWRFSPFYEINIASILAMD